MINKDTELNKIKTLLDITDEKEMNKLDIYYDDAEETILQLTNRKELVDGMNGIIRDLVIYTYKLKDVQGIASVSEGDESTTFVDTTKIPSNIYSRINRYKQNVVCLYD